VEKRTIHVGVHYEEGSYWAQVTEWPSCFATGETLSQLTEALEEAVALIVTPEDEEPAAIQLRVLQMELTLAADRPLVATRANPSKQPTLIARPPRSRDPHTPWHLRGFHRRGEA